MLKDGAVSGAMSVAGGALGNSLHVDKLVGGIKSPILKNVLGGSITGTLVGGTFGGLSAAASGQDIGQGMLGGAKGGAVAGTISGIGSAALYANKNNVNIITGKPNPVPESPLKPLPTPRVGFDVEKASPNVKSVLNTLDDIRAQGGTVKVNSTSPNQEINLTIQNGDQKLDLRIESHKVPIKYGGNGIRPQRHMNIDLYPHKTIMPNNGHVILE